GRRSECAGPTHLRGLPVPGFVPHHPHRALGGGRLADARAAAAFGIDRPAGRRVIQAREGPTPGDGGRPAWYLPPRVTRGDRGGRPDPEGRGLTRLDATAMHS